MARYTIESINEELEQYNWKCISETYKNLNEELIFLCEEGHRVYSTWGKIRNKRECPVCESNKYKDIDTKIIGKKKNVIRTLALDQSTYITGYSIFDGNELIKYGVFETRLSDEVARDHELKIWLISMINNWEPDYIGIEGIQYQQQIGVTVFEMLARLQGVLLDLCYEMNVKCNICHTGVWRKYCGVKGRTRTDKKRSTQNLIKQWYDISVSEDVADAIGIGKYMVEKISKKPDIVSWE